MTNIPEKGFLRHVVSMLARDGVVSVISLVTSVVTARWLGPAQLGLFYTINLIPTFSEKFGRIGMVDHAAVYFLGKKKYPQPQIVGHLLWISAGLSLFPILVFMGGKNLFLSYYPNLIHLPSYYLWTAVVTIPFVFYLIAFNKLQLSLGLIRDFNFNQILKSVIFFSLCLFFAWRRWDVWGIILAGLASTALATIWSGASVLPKSGVDFSLNRPLITDLFGYSWKIYLISLFTLLQQKFDLAVIAAYLDPKEVSYYGLAVGISLLLFKLPNAITGLLYPRVARDQEDDAANFTTTVVRHTFAALILAAIGLAIVCVPFVYFFYGVRYTPLIGPLLILLPGTVALGTGRLFVDHFYGQGHPKAIWRATLVSSPLNVALNLALTPRYGIVAAALISSVTYSIYFLWLMGEFQRRWRRPLGDLLWIKRADLLYLREMLQKRMEKKT